MNPGYVSLWIVLSIVILYATGWRELIADRIRLPYLAVVAGGIVLLATVDTPLTNISHSNSTIAISLACCWMTSWALLAMLFAKPNGSPQRFYIVFAAMFSALVGGWLNMLYMSDPILVIFHPAFDAAILLGLTAALSSPFLVEALFAVVTIGSVAEPFVVRWFAPELQSGPIAIGSLAWWDCFLVSLVTARVISLFAKAVRSKAGKWFVRSTGEQEGGV